MVMVSPQVAVSDDVNANVWVIVLTVSVNVRESVTVGLFESVAVTVNVKSPVTVGVPEITPAVENVTPVGSAPDVSVQVIGAMPPVAVMVAVYAELTVASFNVIASIDRALSIVTDSGDDISLRVVPLTSVNVATAVMS